MTMSANVPAGLPRTLSEARALVSATDVDGFEQPGRALQRLLEIVHRLVGQPPLRIRQAVEDLQGRQFVAPYLEKALEAVDGIGRLPLVPALLCSEFAEAGPSPQPSKCLSEEYLNHMNHL